MRPLPATAERRWRRCDREPPAAVVLDIRLPGMDGWEVLEPLQGRTRRRRTIPVIVVSIVDERRRGLALGAADYLIKPVGRDDLVGALRRVGVPGPGAAQRRGASDDAPPTDPRRRGQPAQPQARPRRARARRVRRAWRATSGEEGVDVATAWRARPGADGPPAARHRRDGGAAADPRPIPAVRSCRSSRSPRSRCARTASAPCARASTATSRSRSACGPCPRRSPTFLRRRADG